MPFLLLFVSKVVLKNKFKQEWLILINFAATYLLIIIGTLMIEFYYDMKMAAFDVNGDGLFTGTEISLAQKAAVDEAQGMSARTLAPAIGAIFSFFYSALFYCTLIAYDGIKAKKQQRG